MFSNETKKNVLCVVVVLHSGMVVRADTIADEDCTIIRRMKVRKKNFYFFYYFFFFSLSFFCRCPHFRLRRTHTCYIHLLVGLCVCICVLCDCAYAYVLCDCAYAYV